ncbi:MAG: VWA domain-containing protein, partial [Myxococcales bacterium]|nr:VWA domain-containing protein [Myxococcales bacterium]
MRPLLALFSTLLVTAAAAAPAGATPEKQDLDRTGSPYFVVKGGSGDTDTMPLESTKADVHIAGTIASVKVTQVYKNDGKDTLEAIYVFPGSTKSAVFGMRMTIGERTIVAEIQKKEEARKLYEAAKAEGKSASLLEQDRPNVFTMNVANILPGDRITVELDYTEVLVPEAGVYELVYPAVVGPRFTGESGKAEGFTETPYTHAGEKPSYGWDVTATIAAGLPIKRVTSSSHPISTTLSANGDTATVTLPNKGAAGTKDFVLQYQLAGDKIASGVLLFEDKGEKFFMTMVQPPARVAPKQMPSREYIFILDVSGSMHGFPLETAKKAMYGLFKGMKPTDRFNIMEFESTPRLLSPESLPATEANIKAAEAQLAASTGGGGTRILEALKKALSLPTPESFSRTFVVVTDGYISVEPEVFELIRDNLGNANLFAFGIGSSVNRYLIEGMARVGMGEPFIVMHDDDAAEKSAKLVAMIDAPALTNISVTYSGFDAYDVEPKTVPDLFASRPVLVFGKYRGKASGTITVSGLSGEGKFEKTLNVADS